MLSILKLKKRKTDKQTKKQIKYWEGPEEEKKKEQCWDYTTISKIRISKKKEKEREKRKNKN